ncbi:MAG: TIGR02117 family protein [Flavobacteriales bacterium]
MLRKFLKHALRALAALVAAIVLYVLLALVLSRIPVPAEADEGSEVMAYILSNGVHTDIVVPVRSAQRDWSVHLPFANTTGRDSTAAWVAFGWGDKGFYLETPTWGDLTASVAFKAMFALGTSAMHVTYHHGLREGPLCKRIGMSQRQYQRLLAYLDKSFAKDAQGRTQVIVTHANYGSNDAFYEGTGSYHLFHTCNTWANNALKTSGQKACLWTALDGGILGQYE